MKIERTTGIITGGASGLGAATARALVRSGGQIAIIDLDREKGEKLADELGDRAIFFPVDVIQEKEMDEAVEKVKEAFGTIHIVCNCAGIVGPAKIVGNEGAMPLERFKRIIQVNLTGTINVIRATAPTLMENTPNEEGERGVYINTASIAAFDGQAGLAAYSSSKGGIVSLTLTLAREFAHHGIRVLTILPGFFDTPMVGVLSEKFREGMVKQVPFPPRLGKPEEFASLTCNMIENPYLNGECIRLDGGLRMGFGRK